MCSEAADRNSEPLKAPLHMWEVCPRLAYSPSPPPTYERRGHGTVSRCPQGPIHASDFRDSDRARPVGRAAGSSRGCSGVFLCNGEEFGLQRPHCEPGKCHSAVPRWLGAQLASLGSAGLRRLGLRPPRSAVRELTAATTSSHSTSRSARPAETSAMDGRCAGPRPGGRSTTRVAALLACARCMATARTHDERRRRCRGSSQATFTRVLEP